MTVHIRPSTLDDYDGITAVCARCELGMVSRDEYLHRWSANPFTPPAFAGQTGWLMETDQGQIVGWVGNIYSGYEWEGRFLLAAGAHAWVVDREHRTQSVPLLARFFRQEGVDLLLNTTANATAASIFAGFKARRLPLASYDRVLYWICDHRRFAEAALRKKQIPLAGALGCAAGTVLAAADSLRRRNSALRLATGQAGMKEEPRLLADFDARFDTAWQQLRQRRGRLLAIRSQAALAWHYHDARSTKRLAIIVLEEQDALAGYAILLRRDVETIGLRRFILADLQVLGDRPALVSKLLTGAIQAAREQSVHVVEAIGFDPFKRGLLEATGPRIRRSPAWPYFYKAFSPLLVQALESSDAWDPCPYDGDAAF